MTIQFRNNPDKTTLDEIELTRKFIRQHAKNLIEIEGDSKWTVGNILFREKDDNAGMYTFMVGALANGKVSLHIMPLYTIDEFKTKYKKEFAPFSSGKSCIHFKNFSDLPIKALIDIVKNGTPLFKAAMEVYYAKRKRK